MKNKKIKKQNENKNKNSKTIAECEWNPLQVPDSSQFEGYSQVGGENCSNWNYKDRDNAIDYSVSLSNNHLKQVKWHIGPFFQGYNFSNYVIGPPDSSFFNPPNCDNFK